MDGLETGGLALKVCFNLVGDEKARLPKLTGNRAPVRRS